MKTDIINTDFIYDHKFFKFWMVPAFVYGGLLVFYTTSLQFDNLIKYDSIIEIISNIFLISGILLFFANIIMFSRIGEMSILNEHLTIDINQTKEIINLEDVTKITLGKEERNFYYLKILEKEIIIELDKTKLSEFEKVMKDFNVKIKHRHFTDRISSWIRKRINVVQHRV